MKMQFDKPTWKDEAERAGESLPGWYTIREATRLLGYSSESYLARLARENRIITYKIGMYRLMDENQVQILLDKKSS